ncbi:MAG: hypothetical protein LQ350_005431 [Teloschistes chrysophthalmus]|nr:MAG: hypothetical protein LQ350_005431 [Niorma chrysophthalma]
MDKPRCHILIIGAGLCGLGAAIAIALEGHSVTIFESARELHQVGAGIQIAPNGMRLLRRWGVAESLRSKTSIAKSLSMIRYDGRKILAYREDHGEELKRKYGDAIWCLHRVDLQKALAERAEELGVRIVFNKRVSEVDFAKATVHCEDGCREQGDLIIAADGLWSPARISLLGKQSVPLSAGDLAYRIVLTTDDVKESQELHDVITKCGIRIWLGPRSHAVSYSILDGQMLNIVLLVPDDLPPDVVKAKGDLGEMSKLFEGWDPLLTRMLSYARKADKWRMMCLEQYGRWASDEGTALEDGAALGALLGSLSSKSEIPGVVKEFQIFRRDRVAKVIDENFVLQESFHLSDGEEQEARDVELAKSFGTAEERKTW